MNRRIPALAVAAVLSLNACNFLGGDNSPYADFVYGECIRGDETLMLRKDGTVSAEKIAILTNSEGKTHVHLTSVGRYCASNAKIKTDKIADTLMLKEYFPKDYFVSACSCNSTMDLTLESIDNNIEYVIYEFNSGGRQFFPVRYE